MMTQVEQIRSIRTKSKEIYDELASCNERELLDKLFVEIDAGGGDRRVTWLESDLAKALHTAFASLNPDGDTSHVNREIYAAISSVVVDNCTLPEDNKPKPVISQEQRERYEQKQVLHEAMLTEFLKEYASKKKGERVREGSFYRMFCAWLKRLDDETIIQKLMNSGDYPMNDWFYPSWVHDSLHKRKFKFAENGNSRAEYTEDCYDILGLTVDKEKLMRFLKAQDDKRQAQVLAQ